MPKQKLREEMKARLLAQTPSERAEKSTRITEKLFAQPVFRRAHTVALFASMETEVDTRSMVARAIQEGKRVALPVVDKAKHEIWFCEIKDLLRDTTPGTLGILEPRAGLTVVEPTAFDCVIVPGLAFDAAGWRLGRGAGFYDRFLARLSPGTAKIGIGFSFQLVQQVTRETHDEKLDWILTD